MFIQGNTIEIWGEVEINNVLFILRKPLCSTWATSAALNAFHNPPRSLAPAREGTTTARVVCEQTPRFLLFILVYFEFQLNCRVFISLLIVVVVVYALGNNGTTAPQGTDRS